MVGWVGRGLDGLVARWFGGQMGGRLDELMACKHTYTNLQKVGGHRHFSTRDVSSKFLAHSAEWEVANLRKGGGREGGREGRERGRSIYMYMHFFAIQSLTVVSGARKSLSRKST